LELETVEIQTDQTESPATNGAFQVRLDVFEGPLDLLLKLIERRQLDISRVSLAEVADSFLAYLEAYPNMPPAPLASFVWVASKLILIKSQALLPRPPLAKSDDEEEDPGDELVRRLEAYKRVQEAAKWLRSRETAGLRSYDRPALPEEPVEKREKTPEELGTGLEGVSLNKLVRLVQKRMQLQMQLQAGPPKGTITRGHVVTVAEKVTQLRGRLSRLREDGRIALGEEFEQAAMRSRTDIVVLFMAVLELVRRNVAWAEQDELFGEIWLRRRA
jgi:segregation and condensation protein A